MPNISRKFYWLFCAAWFLCLQPVRAQSPTDRLATADSLYATHQYTRALALYEVLHTQEHVYTPQMLLKMAYIHEGLQHYTRSMYYLQQYYSKQPSRSVLQKMEEVGLQQQLSGYLYTDWDFFKTQFYKYYGQLINVLLFLAAMIVTLLVIRWRRNQRLATSTKIGFLLYLGFIFYFANFLTLGQQGIIQHANVPIMTAPSAGAGFIGSVGVGHKVRILGEQDIWYRIAWQDQTAYIRKNNLLLLPHPLNN